MDRGPFPHLVRMDARLCRSQEWRSVVLSQLGRRVQKVLLEGQVMARRRLLAQRRLGESSTLRMNSGTSCFHEDVETGSKNTEDEANIVRERPAASAQDVRGRILWQPVLVGTRLRVEETLDRQRQRHHPARVPSVPDRSDPLSAELSIHVGSRMAEEREPREPDFVGPEWLKSAFGVARDRFGVSSAELSDRLHLTDETFTAVTGVPVERTKVPGFKPRLIRGGHEPAV